MASDLVQQHLGNGHGHQGEGAAQSSLAAHVLVVVVAFILTLRNAIHHKLSRTHGSTIQGLRSSEGIDHIFSVARGISPGLTSGHL